MNTIPFNTIICMCLCITSIRGSSYYSCLKFKWFIIIWIMFVIMQQTSGCFEKIKSSRSSALSTYYLFTIYLADVVAFLNFTCLFLTPCLAPFPVIFIVPFRNMAERLDCNIVVLTYIPLLFSIFDYIVLRTSTFISS